MSKLRTILFMVAFILPAFILPCRAATNLKPSGFINDYAAVLAPSDRESLEEMAREYEQRTGNEISVAIIASLGGRDIEGYANDIFNTWGIGKKGKNNGVLILVARDDRKMRIEVGYGLEPVLTDGVCGGIIRSILSPAFKRADFAGGLKEAILTIGKVVSGEQSPEKLEAAGKQQEGPPPWWFFLVWQGFCILFASAALGWLGFAILLLIVGSLDVIAVAAFFLRNPCAESILMIGLLAPFGSVFLIGFASAIIHAVVRQRLQRYYGRSWRSHWPVWIGSYPHSSSGGGFGGGGGGFGGGSSGGGGASGSW